MMGKVDLAVEFGMIDFQSKEREYLKYHNSYLL